MPGWQQGTTTLSQVFKLSLCVLSSNSEKLNKLRNRNSLSAIGFTTNSLIYSFPAQVETASREKGENKVKTFKSASLGAFARVLNILQK